MDSDLQERLDASKDLLEDSLERSRNAMERLSGGNWDGARSAMLANMAVRRLARPAPKLAPPLTGDEKTTTGGGSPFQSDGSPLFSENFRRPSFAVRRPSLLGGSRRKSATGRRPSVESGTPGSRRRSVTFKKAAVGPEQAEDPSAAAAAAAAAAVPDEGERASKGS